MPAVLRMPCPHPPDRLAPHTVNAPPTGSRLLRSRNAGFILNQQASIAHHFLVDKQVAQRRGHRVKRSQRVLPLHVGLSRRQPPWARSQAIFVRLL